MGKKFSPKGMFIVGILFSIVIIILAYLQIMNTTVAIIILFNMVAIFAAYSLLSKVRPAPDERTKRLDEQATSWSYASTVYLLCVLILLVNYTPVALSTNSFALILLFFMIYSNVILKCFFRKRGDVSV